MENLFEEFITAFHRQPILGYEQTSNSDENLTDLLRSDKLNSDFDIFLEDGVGSFIAFWNLPDNSRPIVYFNSEGSPFAVIAKDFKEFLSLLYLGTYAVLEITHYLDYQTFKLAYERAGANFDEPEPTGMSSEEIENYENELKEEYENYEEVINWLKAHGIKRPTSFYEQIIGAYNQIPNLQDFLDEQLGKVE